MPDQHPTAPDANGALDATSYPDATASPVPSIDTWSSTSSDTAPAPAVPEPGTPVPSYGAPAVAASPQDAPPATLPPASPDAPPYPEQAYAPPGYPQPGFAQPGYPQPGYPQPGYPAGYDPAPPVPPHAPGYGNAPYLSENKAAGRRQMLIGAGLVVAGIVISLVTVAASNGSGGFVFWGLPLYGVILGIRGLVTYSKG